MKPLIGGIIAISEILWIAIIIAILL